MIIYPSIENLLYYAQAHLLLDDYDVVYARNRILDELKLTDYEEYEVDVDAIDALTNPEAVLTPIVNYAVENGIVTEEQREYFGDKIMNIVMFRPSEVVDMFAGLHGRSAKKAFDWLFDYSVKSDYVKASQIAKNKHWDAKGTKGKLEITINLSKPEKDNKATAKLLETKSKTYPMCNICRENVGYAGHGMYRATLRPVPLELNGEEWFWQYSPYAYFSQHGIAVNTEHTPMKVDADTFKKLFDFVDYAPDYFIGCNAALPRVGGSILTHDHFQGGGKLLPMHKAGDKIKLRNDAYPYIDASIIDWYNNAIRLVSTSREKLIECAAEILHGWEQYNDESVDLIAYSNEKHSTVTPIVRKVDGKYCMEIILRNNRVSEQYPDGIFHAHPEYHNIKKEAIGLIEAQGLFILPARLDRQLAEIEKYLTKEVRYSADKLAPDMVPHKDMIERLLKEVGSSKPSQLEAQLNIRDEISRVCEQILINTAIFKPGQEDKFMQFLASVNFHEFKL
ncbi:MAG: UDP-glucose--hexose-1-phosphate uridylyltransferase [Clostridia bacterium]|nr:UDP-glucose--hexose-1-phosphate uridylyltransferase [Clostridia bacterium]